MKLYPSPELFPFILIILSIQPLSSYVFNGFEIRDLESTTSLFASEASAWTASTLRGSLIYSTCNGTYLLGGYDVLGPTSGSLYKGEYFERIYTSLPSHIGIRFTITFWALDSWDANKSDSFQIQFDSKLLNGWTISNKNFPEKLCGVSSFADLPSLEVVGTVLHNSSTLTLRIISQLDQAPNKESFGFRDVNLLFIDPSLSVSETFCGTSPISLPYNECPCNQSSFNGINGCKMCNSACASCFGPSSQECFKCTPGAFFDGNDCVMCDSSCSVCFGRGQNQCKKCNPGHFMLNNNTCLSACDPPLIKTSDGTTDFCQSPCGQNDFVSQNGACLSSCATPFVQTTKFGIKFCSDPCQGSSNKFLYWDSSCLGSCDPPLVSLMKNNASICHFPCKASEYLLWNGSCITSCDPPMKSQAINNRAICNSPCSSPLDYYYEADQTCRSYCNSPNIIKQNTLFNSCVSQGSNIPGTSMPTSGPDQTTIKDNTPIIQTAITATTAANTAMGTAVTVASVIGSNNPATFGLGGFVKMLPYIRYMEIKYPPKLQMLLDNMNATIISFSFGPAISPEVEASFTKYSLPGKFDEYAFHSSFIVNYWQNMEALLIILCLIVILHLLVILSRNKASLAFVFGRLKLIVQWNFFLMIFCTNLDGVALSTSLEARTLQLDSYLAVMSFVFCIFMNAFTIFVFFLIVYIILDIRKTKLRVSPVHISPPDPNKKWEQFQSLYIGSKEDSLVQHIFMFPFLLRLYVFNLIIAHFFDYPLFQSILILVLGLFMLFYMTWKRPFKSNLVLCQHTTDELIILTINICISFLAFLDAAGKDDDDLREVLGNIIIICNIIFSITTNIYLVAYLYVGFKAAILKMKREKKVGLIGFIIALLAPFEAGGMDVEVGPEVKPEDNPKASIPMLSFRNKGLDITKLSISKAGNLPNNDLLEETGRQSIQQMYLSDSEACSSNNLVPERILYGQSEASTLQSSPYNRLSRILSSKEPIYARIRSRSQRVAAFHEKLQVISPPKISESTPTSRQQNLKDG